MSRPKRDYETFRKRYPKPLEDKFDKIHEEWLIKNAYKKGDKNE